MVLFRLVVYQTNCCILRTSRTLRYSGIEQLSLYTLGDITYCILDRLSYTYTLDNDNDNGNGIGLVYV